MSTGGHRQSIVQLRRLLRRLDRSHSGEESGCPTCSLQRLAAQLVEEIENEAQQLGNDDLRPGAASVTMAVEALIAVIFTLDVHGADEQGRVLQALLDHVGGLVLDQLAQEEEMSAADEQREPDPEPGAAPPAGRRGSLH
jgi:hypothetical protein